MHDTSAKEIRNITLFSVLAVLLILLISITSHYANHQMHSISKNIYQHPLSVSNAALQIQLKILKIHRDMKDIVLSSSEDEILSLLENIKEYENSIEKDFQTVDEKILGEEGHKLLDSVKKLFKECVPIRQEVANLLDNHKLDEAVYITKSKGAIQVKRLETAALKLKLYTHKKADELIAQSEHTFETTKILSLAFILFSIFLIISFAFYLRRKLILYITLAKNKEKELLKSKEYLESIFNTTPGILIQTDGKSISNANSTMLKFFGYKSIEDFRKEHTCICEYFLNEPDTLQADMDGQTWLEYLEGTKAVINKVSMKKDGKVHYFTVNTQKLNSTQRLLVLSDITEMEYLNKRLEIALNSTQDGLWDWDFTTGEVYFSPEWKKQLGYKDSELENSYKSWEVQVHPDDKETAERAYKANINGETEFYENIHRLRHRNGSWVWIRSRGQTEFDIHGTAIRMVGTHTDITKQKELELELREAKQQFDLFMIHLPYLAAIKDEMNRVVYVNPQITEFFNKSPVGKDAVENIGEEYGRAVIEISDKARDEVKQEKILELKLNSKDYIFRVLAFPIPQNSGKIYIGIIYIDITEAYTTQEELKNQEEIMIAQSRHAAMGEMISMIAHQWRQPISAISMGANNLLVDVELENVSEKSIKEESTGILQQTQHLSKTIDDFRDFFRPNKGIEEVEIEDIMDEAIKIIGKSLENSNIVLSIKHDNLPKISTYSRELLQVYLNILKNAKEALTESREKERKISVDITEETDNIITTICDNGGGIDKATISQIFNPYFSTKNEKNGTGLGLYMSKTIVEKHLHGTIAVYNTKEGVCFKVTIPIKGVDNE